MSVVIVTSASCLDATEEPTKPGPPQYTLNLQDGSRVVGQLRLHAFPVRSEVLGKVSIPIERIASITLAEDGQTATIFLENDDRIAGMVEVAAIEVEAAFGVVKVPIANIRTLQAAPAARDAMGQALALYYSFDLPQGGKAKDDGPMGHVGTLRNAKYVAGGVRGWAMEFDGRSSYIEVPDHEVWHFGEDDFSIALWFKFRSVRERQEGPWRCAFVGSSEGPNDRPKWFFGMDPDTLCFHFNGPDLRSTSVARAAFRPALNRWYHLAVTREGNRFTTFIDGKVAASQTYQVVLPDADHPLTIGQVENLGHVDGWMDELRIWKRAMSEEEIGALHKRDSATDRQ